MGKMMKVVNIHTDENRDFRFEEAIKTLRTNIQFSGPDIKTVMFTSAVPGEGKSQITVSEAMSLAGLGKKVLVVDADIRKSVLLTRYQVEQEVHGLTEYLSGQRQMEEVICTTDIQGMDIIFAGPYSPNPSELLAEPLFKELILKKREEYDYILIDAPPTLGGWVMNILCASDKVIIPVEASPWGMFGLANMFEFLNEVKQISPDLEVAGIAVTKVDTRKNYFKQTMETLHQLESIYVFEHVIRVDSSVEWSQDNSIPVVEYRKSSRSAKEYTELAEEVMNRVSR